MAIKKDGTVVIDTLINTKGFNKGVGNMQKSISGLSGTISKLGVAIGVAFSTRAVINFGKECINLGSDLQEVQNVVDVTFGNMSERINEFAKNAITQFGLSELAAKQYASTMGAMLKSMGFNQADVLDMSTTLAGLAGDIASFYNLTGDEAFTKIRAGISGETEPLKQLGINLSVANLEAFALAEGITKSYNAMTEQEKAMLRYKYLLKTTADAQGDFARTSDSWANQTRILAEQFNSLKATIGQGLINAFTPVLKVINTLLAKLQTLANAFKALTEQIFGKQETQQASKNLSAIEDEYSGIADATNDAKKAQDKYLTGLDEIKTFQTQDAVGAVDVSSGLSDVGITEEIVSDTAEIDDILGRLEERFPRLMKFLKDVGAKLKEIVQDIKLGDFEELGKDISELAVLFFDFISDSLAEVDWKGIGNKIGDFLKGIDWLNVIKSGLKLKFNIWKAIAEVWFGSFEAAPLETSILTALGLLKFTGLGKVLAGNLKKALLTGFSLKGIVTALKGFGTSLASGFKALLQTMKFTMAETGASLPRLLSELLLTPIKNFFTVTIPNAITGSWIPHGVVLGIIAAIAKKIKDAMQNAFDTSDWTLGDWFIKTLETSWSGISQQLDMLRVQLEVWWQDTWLYNKLWELGDWWNTYIAPFFTHEKWAELIENVKVAFSTKWQEVVSWWENDVVTWFDEIFDNIKTKSSEAWSDIKTEITDFCDAVKNTFTSFKDGVVSIWNNIVSAIKNSINAIIGVINSMISGITTGINAVIESLNAVKIDTPDWLGGKSFDLNISKIKAPQIPYLASGAVIPPNAPFMAVLGDQKHGTNIEAPLDTIKQAVREVVGSNKGGVLHAHLYLDGREILTSVIDMAKLEQMATGRNPLDLA